VDDVLKYGHRIALGDDSTNPAVYLRLSDPNVLRTLSDSQLYMLRGELSQQDYQHFADERSKLLNPSNSTGPGDLNSSAIKNTLDQRLRELKIDPTPKDDGGNDAARVGAIRRYVDEQVLTAQRNSGKKFNDAETTQFIDRLFAQSAQLRGWTGTYTAPAISAPPGDIPGHGARPDQGGLQEAGRERPDRRADPQRVPALERHPAEEVDGRRLRRRGRGDHAGASGARAAGPGDRRALRHTSRPWAPTPTCRPNCSAWPTRRACR
jgi:hypothetical protein